MKSSAVAGSRRAAWCLGRVAFVSGPTQAGKRQVSSVVDAVNSGTATCVQVMEWSLQRVQASKDAGLNCFVLTADESGALRAAGEADERRAQGSPLSPLDGLPVSIKDNFCVAGMETTAGSKMLVGYVPPFSATPVERLANSGAIVIGKTNMDEFGMGSATAFSAHGSTLNPYPSLEKSNEPSDRLTAGGSSGGAAAATAVGAGILALGSDTGGSVRQPASFCGLVGFKPSYGRVSRHGLVSYASSLDCPGFLGRSIRDVWPGLAVTSGPDSKDSRCARDVDPLTLAIPEPDVQGLRVGIPKEFLIAELPSTVRDWLEASVQWLEAGGATLVEVSLPLMKSALHAYYVIAPAEASSNLARFDGVRYGHREPSGASHGSLAFADGASLNDGASEPEGDTQDAAALHAFYIRNRSAGFGPEVQQRILNGTFVLSESARAQYYGNAVKVRQALSDQFNSVLSGPAGVDVLLAPTAPTLPWPVESTSRVPPLNMYANDVMTVPASLAGLPAASVPVGLVDGLPVGMQVIGPAFGEALVARVAGVLEDSSGFLESKASASLLGTPPF